MNLEDSGRGHPASPAETMAPRARAMLRQRRDFIDPPEWDSLGGCPALQAAARECYTDGCRWADAALHALPRRGKDAAIFEWHVVRDAADPRAAAPILREAFSSWVTRR